jgi:ribosome biogenesis GTPase / thiamine phosphate phosphatase
MFSLEFGGSLIDTPGMKLFGLWDIAPEEVALLYREMQPYVGQCKFGLSCTHSHEPGCAIRAAVERGDIDERRYDSYHYMVDHLDTYGE